MFQNFEHALDPNHAVYQLKKNILIELFPYNVWETIEPLIQDLFYLPLPFLELAAQDGVYFLLSEYMPDKAEWYGREMIIAPSNYASSQLCSECGYKNPDVKNSRLRDWTCPECGAHHDRDENAAKNLEKLIPAQ